MIPASHPFDPNLPLSKEMGEHKDALLIPWGSQKTKGSLRAAGVFDASGRYLPEAVCWRYAGGPATEQPEYALDETPETLSGRYLFGGLLYSHFGHFICESLGRLWALDYLQQPVDGIVFFPKPSLTWPVKLTRTYLTFFAAMGYPELKIEAPQKPVRIEHLTIAEQGFGVSEMAAGRPEFREFMRRKLGQAIAPDGPEKIYISREKLPAKRGSILHEDRLADLLEKQGYVIFHPQEHPIEVQIARYKAARKVVSLDASPLHLAAMIVPPECEVAILNRGPSQNIEDYLRQFRFFAGVEPLRVDAVTDFWALKDRKLVKRETYSLLDFRAVAEALAAAGFISSTKDWRQLTEAEISSEVERLEGRRQMPLERHAFA
jgi:capsular polysaccharide biosynthesis protein